MALSAGLCLTPHEILASLGAGGTGEVDDHDRLARVKNALKIRSLNPAHVAKPRP